VAYSIKDDTLASRTARLSRDGGLPIRRKPYFRKIDRGVELGYRRNETNGTWVVRVRKAGITPWTKTFAAADDYEEANGKDVMTFYQAQVKARKIARGEDDGVGVDGTKPLTIEEAVEAYKASLRARGRSEDNARTALVHVPESIKRKLVAELTSRELRDYRDDLTTKVSRSSVNRILCPLKAALNDAAKHDARIKNRQAWTVGLEGLKDARESRNQVIIDITDDQVRRIVELGYEMHGPKMGLLIEMAAATGSRASQLKRITVRDLQTGVEARVMIPVSDKGPGKKAIRERPIPILPSLAIKLQRVAEGRRPGDWLLVDEEGGQWRKKAENDPFKAITKRLGILDDAEQPVTMYALRHYSITRQLLNGVPESVVADAHDTRLD
jgi:integrase